MNSLPLNLLDQILFRLDPKSLGMMRCTNRSLETYISKDPSFKSEYLSRMGSSLVHMGGHGSTILCFHPSGDARTFQNDSPLESLCHVLGYCSGLLLLLVDRCLCVANPLTKKFRFLDRSILQTRNCIGFAVDQIDPTTQRFKIVCITELKHPNPGKTRYQFHIHAGVSWRVSETTITCAPSNLSTNTKSVYFCGALYWLRDDGNMVTFNPETLKAGLITITFNREEGAKLLFGASDNCLTLISATEKVIYVYALEGILTDPKWIMTRQIRNEPVQQSTPLYWNVEAFDGRRLVVRTMKLELDGVVINDYDLRANTWGVVGSIPRWCDGTRDFYQFKPSWSSVVGLPYQNYGPMSSLFIRPQSQRDSVEGIMELINRNLKI